jgi:glycosyltransferase involved in cell wall biosynthesis
VKHLIGCHVGKVNGMPDTQRQQLTLEELLVNFESLRKELADTRDRLHATQQSLEKLWARRRWPGRRENAEAGQPAVEHLQAHRQWQWRQFLRKLLGVRLAIMQQYHPRPIGLPSRYHKCCPAAAISMSVVTPSYNQGAFIEQTLQSVLQQGYQPLQYIVQDGRSVDDTAIVLNRYRGQLAHCESRKDRGQSHALNLGFQHATGEIMAYLNSDDLLLPGTLHYVARYFADHPEIDVVYGHRIVVDEHGAEIGRWVLPSHNDAVLSWADYIPQETLFWRRRIWDRVGAQIDESFQFAMDWDLILRFREAGARFVRLPRFLGAFRFHAQQKTTSQLAIQGFREMNRLRERCHGRPVSFSEIATHLSGYYLRHCLHHTLYLLGILRY